MYVAGILITAAQRTQGAVNTLRAYGANTGSSGPGWNSMKVQPYGPMTIGPYMVLALTNRMSPTLNVWPRISSEPSTTIEQ